MPHFETFTLVKWLHFVAVSIAGGAAVVALMLSGFEEEREDLRGLAATVWKKMVTWPFRVALLLGLALWAIRYRQNLNMFMFAYFHWKLALVLALLSFSEMAPKALAAGKRGAALLAIFFFLLATFVTLNASAFPVKVRPQQGAPMPEAPPTLQAH